ncbi:MAG: STAS/SEC14 domain-containing protein [Janthinobacterium lividum]
MNLLPLCSSPQVSVYFDSWNNWLYVEWEGEITLPVAQQACVNLAHCVLKRPYARVLNNNSSMTSVGLEVGAWLALHFMPHLHLAGVKHMAWVCSPTLAGQNLVQTIMNWLPRLEATLFTDMEDAVHWLQQRQLTPSSEATRLPATQAKLARLVADLERVTTAKPASRPTWWPLGNRR